MANSGGFSRQKKATDCVACAAACAQKDAKDTTLSTAAVYRNEATGQLILVSRDTQPNSLVDWQTNTRNGEGIDPDQYKAARKLAGVLVANDVPFDVAGYSKGGGLAQEAGLVNPDAKVYVFNSSGLHPASLARTGATDFKSLAGRTQAYNAENEFLTYMNETRDPARSVEHARFLRTELAGEGAGINPISTPRSPRCRPTWPPAGPRRGFRPCTRG